MLPSVEKYDSFESLKSAPVEPVSPEEQARNYALFNAWIAQIRAAPIVPYENLSEKLAGE